MCGPDLIKGRVCVCVGRGSTCSSRKGSTRGGGVGTLWVRSTFIDVTADTAEPFRGRRQRRFLARNIPSGRALVQVAQRSRVG